MKSCLRALPAVGLVVGMLGILFGLTQDRASAQQRFVLYPAAILSQQNGGAGGGVGAGAMSNQITAITPGPYHVSNGTPATQLQPYFGNPNTDFFVLQPVPFIGLPQNQNNNNLLLLLGLLAPPVGGVVVQQPVGVGVGALGALGGKLGLSGGMYGNY